ncbi:hypothetical protein H9P43_003684 [Blastocladiella emersonii ATCC 22665]|nr:hypothetical protein H9P43_003684 [Blastocladiella emersonii ATCC 22665]
MNPPASTEPNLRRQTGDTIGAATGVAKTPHRPTAPAAAAGPATDRRPAQSAQPLTAQRKRTLATASAAEREIAALEALAAAKTPSAAGTARKGAKTPGTAAAVGKPTDAAAPAPEVPYYLAKTPRTRAAAAAAAAAAKTPAHAGGGDVLVPLAKAPAPAPGTAARAKTPAAGSAAGARPKTPATVAGKPAAAAPATTGKKPTAAASANPAKTPGRAASHTAPAKTPMTTTKRAPAPAKTPATAAAAASKRAAPATAKSTAAASAGVPGKTPAAKTPVPTRGGAGTAARTKPAVTTVSKGPASSAVGALSPPRRPLRLTPTSTVVPAEVAVAKPVPPLRKSLGGSSAPAAAPGAAAKPVSRSTGSKVTPATGQPASRRATVGPGSGRASLGAGRTSMGAASSRPSLGAGTASRSSSRASNPPPKPPAAAVPRRNTISRLGTASSAPPSRSGTPTAAAPKTASGSSSLPPPPDRLSASATQAYVRLVQWHYLTESASREHAREASVAQDQITAVWTLVESRRRAVADLKQRLATDELVAVTRELRAEIDAVRALVGAVVEDDGFRAAHERVVGALKEAGDQIEYRGAGFSNFAAFVELVEAIDQHLERLDAQLDPESSLQVGEAVNTLAANTQKLADLLARRAELQQTLVNVELRAASLAVAPPAVESVFVPLTARRMPKITKPRSATPPVPPSVGSNGSNGTAPAPVAAAAAAAMPQSLSEAVRASLEPSPMTHPSPFILAASSSSSTAPSTTASSTTSAAAPTAAASTCTCACTEEVRQLRLEMTTLVSVVERLVGAHGDVNHTLRDMRDVMLGQQVFLNTMFTNLVGLSGPLPNDVVDAVKSVLDGATTDLGPATAAAAAAAAAVAAPSAAGAAAITGDARKKLAEALALARAKAKSVAIAKTPELPSFSPLSAAPAPAAAEPAPVPAPAPAPAAPAPAAATNGKAKAKNKPSKRAAAAPAPAAPVAVPLASTPAIPAAAAAAATPQPAPAPQLAPEPVVAAPAPVAQPAPAAATSSPAPPQPIPTPTTTATATATATTTAAPVPAPAPVPATSPAPTSAPASKKKSKAKRSKTAASAATTAPVQINGTVPNDSVDAMLSDMNSRAQAILASLPDATLAAATAPTDSAVAASQPPPASSTPLTLFTSLASTLGALQHPPAAHKNGAPAPTPLPPADAAPQDPNSLMDSVHLFMRLAAPITNKSGFPAAASGGAEPATAQPTTDLAPLELSELPAWSTETLEKRLLAVAANLSGLVSSLPQPSQAVAKSAIEAVSQVFYQLKAEGLKSGYAPDLKSVANVFTLLGAVDMAAIQSEVRSVLGRAADPKAGLVTLGRQQPAPTPTPTAAGSAAAAATVTTATTTPRVLSTKTVCNTPNDALYFLQLVQTELVQLQRPAETPGAKAFERLGFPDEHAVLVARYTARPAKPAAAGGGGGGERKWADLVPADTMSDLAYDMISLLTDSTALQVVPQLPMCDIATDLYDFLQHMFRVAEAHKVAHTTQLYTYILENSLEWELSSRVFSWFPHREEWEFDALAQTVAALMAHPLPREYPDRLTNVGGPPALAAPLKDECAPLSAQARDVGKAFAHYCSVQLCRLGELACNGPPRDVFHKASARRANTLLAAIPAPIAKLVRACCVAALGRETDLPFTLVLALFLYFCGDGNLLFRWNQSATATPSLNFPSPSRGLFDLAVQCGEIKLE